jgi:hypothetical protein
VDLDRWLPDAQVRTLHRRTAHVSAEELWHAAETVRVCDAPTLGRIVRWRIPGTPPDLPFVELFSRYPFTVLDEGERYLVSGLCGRIWTLRRDYPRIDGPDEFLAWDKPNTVRVLFAHWIEDGSTLVSESRIAPIGRRASVQTRILWSTLGRFERFIGREALRVAVRRADGG